MGGTHLAYQVFFSACNILAALILFLAFRSKDMRRASLVALLFLGNPFAVYHSTFNPQDEPLVLLFFLAPLVLLVGERFYSSALATGLGIWTKMWPLLLTPLYMIERRPWVDRWKAIAVIITISSIIIVPFLIICPEDVVWFLRFYFLGIENEGAGGVSLWRFLDDVGVKPPAPMLLGLVGAVVLGGYWYCRRKGWDQWTTVTVVVVLFFLFYPKVHSGYFLLPLALLLPYMVENLRLYYLTIPLFVSVAITHKFHVGSFPTTGGLILIPIMLALLTSLLLVYILDQAVLTPRAEMREGEGSWTLARVIAFLTWVKNIFSGRSRSDRVRRTTCGDGETI
jgi:uncharacterized membrane protein